MNKEQIISHLISKGADVHIRSFKPGEETICVYVNREKVEKLPEMRVWKHGVFLNFYDGSWFVGYSQSGKTRALTEKEMLNIMGQWIANPDDKIFMELETNETKQNAKFKVEQTVTVSGRGAIVFAQPVDDNDFDLSEKMYLNGVKVTHADIPRALDEHGKQRLDIWGFCIEDEKDLSHFFEGQIVELKYREHWTKGK